MCSLHVEHCCEATNHGRLPLTGLQTMGICWYCRDSILRVSPQAERVSLSQSWGCGPVKLDGPLSCRCNGQGQPSACSEAGGEMLFPVKRCHVVQHSGADFKHLMWVQDVEAAACGRQRGWGTPCLPQRSQGAMAIRAWGPSPSQATDGRDTPILAACLCMCQVGLPPPH